MLAGSHDGFLIPNRPLIKVSNQAAVRPIRPFDSLATSVRNAAVICRPIEIRRERQFSNDASYQLIGG
jgi:hypothetical protein